jgi:hypothetical protein
MNILFLLLCVEVDDNKSYSNAAHRLIEEILTQTNHDILLNTNSNILINKHFCFVLLHFAPNNHHFIIFLQILNLQNHVNYNLILLNHQIYTNYCLILLMNNNDQFMRFLNE